MLRLLFLCLLLLPTGGLAAGLAGAARVIDGDTLRVGNDRVRLFGIDAPEREQTCLDAGGASWACGLAAADALRRLLDSGPLICREIGKDRYGRIVATCRRGDTDLGAALVADGWAVAFRRYSLAYAGQEAQARAARRGLWRGRFDLPEQHRAARRSARQASAAPDQAPDTACAIKGNISAAGRIYHMPGSRDYARTVIRPERGERWFCSAAQARAAGWRRGGG